MAIGFLAMTIGVGIAMLVGSVSGYFGGYIDALLQRFAELVLMFPSFTLGKYTEVLEFQGVEPDVEQADRLPYAAGRDPILSAGVTTILELAVR